MASDTALSADDTAAPFFNPFMKTADNRKCVFGIKNLVLQEYHYIRDIFQDILMFSVRLYSNPTCQQGLILLKGKCVSNCGNGYFPDALSENCMRDPPTASHVSVPTREEDAKVEIVLENLSVGDVLWLFLVRQD